MEVLRVGCEGLLRQLVIGLGPLCLVSVALYLVIRWTQRSLMEAIGRRGLIYWTGWLGAPVHEASHWLVGTLCGLKIVEVKLFAPDERTGVLGYVKYVQPKLELTQLHKVVGTFLMGIAPLFGGTAAITLAFWLIVSPEAEGAYAREVRELMASAQGGSAGDVLRGFAELMLSFYRAIFAGGLGDWRGWLFLYVALAIGAHLAPSNADLEGGFVGFLVLLGLALVGNLVAAAAGADPRALAGRLAEWTAPGTAFLLCSLALNLGNLILAVGVSWLRQAFSPPA